MSKKAAKILVSDDDPAILEVLQLILEDEGYEVETSIDGEAIYKLERDYPNLLLLDIWMSGMDGREICRYVKNQRGIKHIPVIMLSANKYTEAMAKECGADDFLLKPFEAEELLALVHKYIQS